MFRNLFFILNILPLVFLTTVSDLKKDELKIDILCPKNGERGKEILVNLNFTRGSVKGFAKYTEEIPAGFEIEPVELGDATFTFDARQLKIIWLNIPDQDNFNISYKLKVSTDAPGALEVGGKFSYLENNEKKTYYPIKKNIKIGSAEELTAAAAQKEDENKTTPAQANVCREIIESNGDVHTIQITVKKQGIEGFSKIEEIVPMGAKVTEIESKNAVFSSIKNKVKFVWMSVPSDAQFLIKYSINLANCSNKDPKTLKGEFSYLDNNESKKLSIVNCASDVLAKSEPNPEENKAPETNPTPKENLPVAIEPKEESLAVVTVPVITNKEENEEELKEPVPANEPEPEEEMVEPVPETSEPESQEESEESNAQTQQEEVITSTPPKVPELEPEPIIENEPEPIKNEEPVVAKASNAAPSFTPPSGINYRVQIAAGKNLVDAQYFEKRHQWTNEFVIENHEGWVKYTAGSFPEYKLARDSREEINAGGHKFMGPFVTAYNDGTRITVQEALMVTKQKWFK